MTCVGRYARLCGNHYVSASALHLTLQGHSEVTGTFPFLTATNQQLLPPQPGQVIPCAIQNPAQSRCSRYRIETFPSYNGSRETDDLCSRGRPGYFSPRAPSSGSGKLKRATLLDRHSWC